MIRPDPPLRVQKEGRRKPSRYSSEKRAAADLHPRPPAHPVPGGADLEDLSSTGRIPPPGTFLVRPQKFFRPSPPACGPSPNACGLVVRPRTLRRPGKGASCRSRVEPILLKASRPAPPRLWSVPKNSWSAPEHLVQSRVRGRSMTILVPKGTFASARTSPPWSDTIWRTMASPRPVPPLRIEK